MRKYFVGLALLLILAGGAIIVTYIFLLGSGKVVREMSSSKGGLRSLALASNSGASGGGQGGPIRLSPAMNPLRVNASVDYSWHVGYGRLYAMSARLLDADGRQVWHGEHLVSRHRTGNADRDANDRRGHNHNFFTLGTFNIQQAGAYVLRATIDPDHARVTSASLTLRRNVVTVPAYVPVAGGVSLAAGMLILIAAVFITGKKSGKMNMPGDESNGGSAA